MLKPVKRKGSPFYIARGTINGQQVERSTKTASLTIAKQRCLEIANEIIQGSGAGEASPYTFRDAVEDYLLQGGSNRFLQKPLDYLGAIEANSINSKLLYEAARVLYPNAQKSTINRQLFTPVSAVLKCASDNELCSPKTFRRPKSDNPRTDFRTPQEADILIAGCHSSLNGFMPSIMTFFFGQGTRCGETLLIQGTDVNLDGNYCIIPPENAKKDNERRVILVPRVRAALSNLPTVGKPGALFRNTKGMPFKIRRDDQGTIIGGGQLAKVLTPIVKRCALPDTTPHTCRHTWATWFYSQTRDPIRLKDQGGWAKEEMWMRYTKIGTHDLGEQARKHGWEFEPSRINEINTLHRSKFG